MKEYKGVTFVDKSTVYIDEKTEIEEGAVIYPNNTLLGSCVIKKNAVLMPNNVIEDSYIGENCSVISSVIVKSRIEKGAAVGPFAYIRPHCEIDENSKVGSFVELKKAKLGKGTKVPHLSYVGDAEVGENTNIGCGVIFANYNGKTKSEIRVGNNCFIGSNVNLIAPLNIGGNSYIAAGSTVTKDVEEGEFIIGRVKASANKKLAAMYIGGKE